jgi:hypothetical protein
MRILSILRIVAIAVAAMFVSTSQAEPSPFADEATLSLAFNRSAEVTLNTNAEQILESGQRIRLEYGAITMGQILKLKSVIAPAGLAVNLKDWSLKRKEEIDLVSLRLSVKNTQYNSGNHAVWIVLENIQTSATVKLLLTVHVP